MRKDLTISFWEDNVDKILTDHYMPLLDNSGSRSHKQMEKKVDEIYLEFDKRRKEFDAKLADWQDEDELKMLEEAEKKICRK